MYLLLCNNECWRVLFKEPVERTCARRGDNVVHLSCLERREHGLQGARKSKSHSIQMKTLTLSLILAAQFFTGIAWAKDAANADIAYKCVSRSGNVAIGTGRLSAANEYSNFLKKYATAGEYVIFRYPNEKREYWFKSSNCTKV
jgi:hypothetical protein